MNKMDDLIMMDFLVRMKEGMEVGWREFAAGKKGRKKRLSSLLERPSREGKKVSVFLAICGSGSYLQSANRGTRALRRECCLHSTSGWGTGWGEDSDVSRWDPSRTAIDWPQEHPQLPTRAETVSYP